MRNGSWSVNIDPGKAVWYEGLNLPISFTTDGFVTTAIYRSRSSYANADEPVVHMNYGFTTTPDLWDYNLGKISFKIRNISNEIITSVTYDIIVIGV